jgi:hypothetical protein
MSSSQIVLKIASPIHNHIKFVCLFFLIYFLKKKSKTLYGETLGLYGAIR